MPSIFNSLFKSISSHLNRTDKHRNANDNTRKAPLANDHELNAASRSSSLTGQIHCDDFRGNHNVGVSAFDSYHNNRQGKIFNPGFKINSLFLVSCENDMFNGHNSQQHFGNDDRVKELQRRYIYFLKMVINYCLVMMSFVVKK